MTIRKPRTIEAILALVIIAGFGFFFIYRDIQNTTAKNKNLGQREQKDSTSEILVELQDVEGQNIEGAQVEIIEDTTSLDSLTYWINLGLEKRIAGDYEGAREAWEHASKIRPQNTLSFHNLGQLYAYFLKDFVKAEFNFKTAIANDPKLSYLYISFFEFYRDVMEDPKKAEEILEQGLEVPNLDNPEALRSLLSSLQ